MEEKIKVILIEDNREYADVISFALNHQEDIQLLKRYATAEIALRELERTPVDVILLDLNLPGMSGIEAIPYILEYSPKTKIITLTQSDAEADILDAISLGASGYLLKAVGIEQIISSIKSVMNGGASFDPKVAKYILNNLNSRLPKSNIRIDLSDRQKEILNLIREGYAKKEIADRLSISYTTVDSHVRSIYEKLQVTNAPSAVNKAYKLGIFTVKS